MAEECAAISPAVLQAACGQGTSSSLLLNFRSPNTLFPDLPLMRSWIASLVFCGNSSGKLGFLCMALAVTAENRAAVGKSFLCRAARSWAGFNRSQCVVEMGEQQGIQSCGCASALGISGRPGGIRGIFRIYFATWFVFIKCLCQIGSRELWVRQKGNLWYPVLREEQRKEWIPWVQHTFVASLFSPPWCWTIVFVAALNEPWEREMCLLGRREGAQAVECLLLSSCECLYLWSSQHSCAVTRAFLSGIWLCRLRMSLSVSLNQKDDTCALV